MSKLAKYVDRYCKLKNIKPVEAEMIALANSLNAAAAAETMGAARQMPLEALQSDILLGQYHVQQARLLKWCGDSY